MRLALVYNPNDRKLLANSYSQTYRDMFLALQERFEKVYYVTMSCDAVDIPADVFIFYDIHSSHDITINGLNNHKAIKYEYFNDPHQIDHDFTRNGVTVHKRGAEGRAKRATKRDVKYIICPCRDAFDKYIKPHGMFELVWFPVAPKSRFETVPSLIGRQAKVLANGNLWEGTDDFKPYEFRNWVFRQPYVSYETKVAAGEMYQRWLASYAGALALCDVYVVPKYLEIPMSGCLCFAQYNQEYEDLGFKDGEHYIRVDKNNIEKKIKDFLNNVNDYQTIADSGRKMALNYTADKFADYIYNHAKELICQ